MESSLYYLQELANQEHWTLRKVAEVNASLALTKVSQSNSIALALRND